MSKVDFESKGGPIQGVLIATSVGEIYFLNIQNLPKLPEDVQ